MSYSTSNPPRLVVQSIGNKGAAIWRLEGTDATATVDTSGYITNGGNLGMKAGDTLIYDDTNLKITYSYRVLTVSSTAPGAVDLADGTVIGSSTNTD